MPQAKRAPTKTRRSPARAPRPEPEPPTTLEDLLQAAEGYGLARADVQIVSRHLYGTADLEALTPAQVGALLRRLQDRYAAPTEPARGTTAGPAASPAASPAPAQPVPAPPVPAALPSTPIRSGGRPLVGPDHAAIMLTRRELEDEIDARGDDVAKGLPPETRALMLHVEACAIWQVRTWTDQLWGHGGPDELKR